MRAAGNLPSRLDLPGRASWVTGHLALLFWRIAKCLSRWPLLALVHVLPIVLHSAAVYLELHSLNSACAIPGCT